MAAFLPIMSGVSCGIRQAGCPRIDDRSSLPRWSVLFRGVHTFGRVISFCGNSCGVLGSIGGYPEVWCTPCGRSASGANLKYFFPCWNRAFVTIEEQSDQWHYSVAFLDGCADVLHTVCLPPGIPTGRRFSGGSGSTTRRVPKLRSHRVFARPHELKDRPVEGEVVPLSKQEFSALLRMIKEEISIQIFVGNDGLKQTAEMRPTHLREDADWIYAADDCCGLRMRIARLAEIFFHGSSGSTDWALRAFEPEGRLVCAITPPKESGPGERRETRIKLEAAWEENAK